MRGGMKNPPRARLGYARATGERSAAAGAVAPCRREPRRHISPVPLDGVATAPVLRRLGTVRRGVIQKPRPSRVRSKASFKPCTDAVTQRVTAATARPERSDLFGRAKSPPKGPAGATGWARKDRIAAWSGAGWQQPASLPRLGRSRKPGSPNCKSNAA